MIKKLRIQKNISQRELSRITGISQGYISKLEDNDSNYRPTIRNILDLANGLGVEANMLVKYFIDREGKSKK